MNDIKLLFEQFISNLCHIQNYSKSTINGYKDTFRLFLKDKKIENLNQINQELVEQWLIEGRIYKSRKPSTYIFHHKHLNVFYKWLLRKGKIENNFITDIEKPKLEYRLPNRLNKEQSEILLQLTRSFKYKYRYEKYRNTAIVALMIFGGLRKSEVLNLKIYEINFETSIINITQGKGKKDRIIPICSRLSSILKEYSNERIRLGKTCEHYITTSQYDKKSGVKCINMLIKKLKDKTGYTFSAHSLRHTFATLMIEGGCDIYTLSKIMGHSRITTTTIYLACSSQLMLKNIEKHPLN